MAEAAAGRSQVLVVTGEPGIGKSALLGEAARLADGFRVLAIAGVAAESELSFAGLRALLEPSDDELAQLPGDQANSLRALLAIVQGEPDLHLAYAGALSLLAERASREPVLVLIDDAQWLDDGTLQAVFFAARRLHAERVAVIVAQRSGGRSPFVRAGFEELSLTGLADEHARALARRHAPDGLSERELAGLLESAAGNPLVVVELAGRDGAPAASDASLAERLFGERLRNLSAAARAAIVVLAASDGDEFDPLLEAARSFEGGFDAWEEAEAAGLIVLEPGRVRFRHPLAAAAVEAMSAGAERRAAHAAIARALEARGERARAAWQRASAAVGADEAIAAALETAAEEFTRRSGHLGAARALERAARLSPLAAQQAQRLVAAAEAARRAQHDDEADEWAVEALTLAEDPALRRRAELVRAGVEAWRGSLTASRHRYLEVARSADPGIAADALSRAAAVAVVGGDTASALTDAEAALAAGGDAATALAARETLASVLVLRGELPRARPYLDEIVAHYESAGDRSGAQFAALTLAWVEDLERATRFADGAVDRARASRNMRDLAQALEIRADIRFRHGDLRHAAADAEESAGYAEDMREPVQSAFSLAILAVVTAAQGDDAATRAHVARAGALAEAHGLRVLEEYAGFALGLLELGRGDAQRALDALEPVAEYVAGTGRGTAGILFWPADLIQAAIRGGREELARAELARLEEQAAATGLTWARAIVERSRGQLAPKDAFDAPFRAALAQHERLPMEFERARTQLAYGERLQRVGRRTDARDQLTSAIATFKRLGARDWLPTAQDLHEATGERRRRPDSFEPAEELTTTELRVANAAVSGKANKVIAQELFLSVKTVEAHLTRAYRKHGVNSRTELAARMRERGDH